MKKNILYISLLFLKCFSASAKVTNTEQKEQPCITGKEASCQKLSKQYPTVAQQPCAHCISIISGDAQPNEQKKPVNNTPNSALNEWTPRNPTHTRKPYQFNQ